MATILIHQPNPEEESEFTITVNKEPEINWIDIIRGDDTTSIFFKTKLDLSSFLSKVKTEIFAYEVEQSTKE